MTLATSISSQDSSHPHCHQKISCLCKSEHSFFPTFLDTCYSSSIHQDLLPTGPTSFNRSISDLLCLPFSSALGFVAHHCDQFLKHLPSSEPLISQVWSPTKHYQTWWLTPPWLLPCPHVSLESQGSESASSSSSKPLSDTVANSYSLRWLCHNLFPP